MRSTTTVQTHRHLLTTRSFGCRGEMRWTLVALCSAATSRQSECQRLERANKMRRLLFPGHVVTLGAERSPRTPVLHHSLGVDLLGRGVHQPIGGAVWLIILPTLISRHPTLLYQKPCQGVSKWSGGVARRRGNQREMLPQQRGDRVASDDAGRDDCEAHEEARRGLAICSH